MNGKAMGILLSLGCATSAFSAQEGTILTAEDQAKATTHDTEVSRQIRREIVHQKELSTAAKNVKIITLNGEVTLKGSVESAKERALVNQIAGRIAGGEGRIRDQLVVTEK